jgi:cytochrome oxidase Cu insertion factor (SCO1/SenC/PrrC family)
MLARELRHLLVVTVIPEHAARPQGLREGQRQCCRWSFLTGAPAAVDVASRFGVLYSRRGAQVLHQQAVAVVDPEGRLATISYGENWEPEQVFKDMEKARK